MKTTQILAAFVAMLPIFGASAQEDSHRQKAEELLALMNTREMMLTAFESTTAQLLQSVPENKKEAVKEAFLKFAKSVADSPELNNGLTDLYAANFTEPELIELIAFYSSPVGKKSLEKMPELFQKGAALGESVATAKQAAFHAELQAIMAQE